MAWERSAEAAEAAEKLQSAIFDVAQKAVAVERNKENTNRDATVATLKAEFEAAKLKAANAKKTADEIKADAEARSMRKDFERKLEKTRKKKAKLKEEIDALTGRSILERLMPG